MDNGKYILDVYKKGIDVGLEYGMCLANTVDVKMSRGNKSHVPYGIYPPHENIYILLANKNHGHLTKKEKGIDNKYYFDCNSKLLLIETFDPYGDLGYDVFPYYYTFFKYEKNTTHIVTCRTNKTMVAAVAKCEFDDNGRVTNYIEGNDDFHEEMCFEYVGTDIYVTFDRYENTGRHFLSEKYLCRDDKIIRRIR